MFLIYLSQSNKEKDEKGAFQIPTKSRELWPNGVVPYMIDPAGGYCKNTI